LGAASTFSACSDGGTAHEPRATTVPTPAGEAAQRIPLRGCENSAYGDLGNTPVNRAGPIGFVDSWARSQPVGEHRGSRVRPTKVLVVVDAGATVTVAVPEADRERLRLLYADTAPDSTDGFHDFADGDIATTFQACEPGQNPFGEHAQTQFPGYFLVKEAGCYGLEVSARGVNDTLAKLSLGTPCYTEPGG
jgi:hypothetical protein